jgi:hypothetical protein
MKPVACWFGKHSWTTRIDHGEEFSVCSACGKERRGGGGDGGRQREHNWEMIGPGGGPGP